LSKASGSPTTGPAESGRTAPTPSGRHREPASSQVRARDWPQQVRRRRCGFATNEDGAHT
jgi:hypothetical protein